MAMINDVLNRLRRQVAAPLEFLRDAPAAPSAPAPRPAPVAAVARDERWSAALLEARDMKPGAWNAGQWSAVGYFNVPEGVRYAIPEGRAYRIYIRARHTQAGTNITGPAPTTVAGLDLADTPQQKTVPSLYHPEIAVWCKVGGVWQRVAVDAVDYATGSVTFQEPDNCTDVEVYYVHSTGEWRIRVQREMGASDSQATTVNNGSFGAAHFVDQNNLETLHKWPQVVQLVSGQRLTFEVNSTLEHVFNERAGQVLTIFSYVQQLAVLDKALLRAAAAAELQGR